MLTKEQIDAEIDSTTSYTEFRKRVKRQERERATGQKHIKAALVRAFDGARECEERYRATGGTYRGSREEEGYFRACHVLGSLLVQAGLSDAAALELGLFWIDEKTE